MFLIYPSVFVNFYQVIVVGKVNGYVEIIFFTVVTYFCFDVNNMVELLDFMACRLKYKL